MKVMSRTKLREETALIWSNNLEEFAEHFHSVEDIDSTLRITHYGLTYDVAPGETVIVAERPAIFSSRKFTANFRQSPAEYARQLLAIDPTETELIRSILQEMEHDYS